jgi:pimeloyl-ACP methyl ester carboxylesterase
MKQLILYLAMIAVVITGYSQSESYATSPDGVRIAYEVDGEGSTTIVFVHGWSCDRSYWKAQLQPFSKEYKVVAIDLGGHGESGFGRENWTISSFGDDVVAVVDTLDLNRVILVGHSMGGNVIVRAARRLSGQVLGLVMVDTYKKIGSDYTAEEDKKFVDGFRTRFAEKVTTFVRRMFLPDSNPDLVEFVVNDMSSAPPAVALSSLESSFNYGREVTRDLSELKMPVIALNPDNEPTDTENLHQYGVEVVVLPGLGHFLMMEDPKLFNETLASIITRLNR